LNLQKYSFDPLYHKSENFRINWKHISITPPSVMKFYPVVPERSNSAFSKFSRCLPFSKWLPKHGIKMGDKNSTLSDIIKI
jgi:hypothetical protein